MIYAPVAFVVADTNDAKITIDVNIPVQPNLLATVNLTGLSALRFMGSSFAGITQYTRLDASGARVQINTASGPFGCTPVISDFNIDTLTWVLGAVNEVTAIVQAGLLILTVAPDGTFS